MSKEKQNSDSSDLEGAALFYHANPRPGKTRDPGHKAARQPARSGAGLFAGRGCPLPGDRDDPGAAALYTGRANLVGVVSNGSAVLGLGNIGPLASKPVMEGKAVLFKEVSPESTSSTSRSTRRASMRWFRRFAALEPTFAGSSGDIKAPECFEVEEQLKARMRIPVFHDGPARYGQSSSRPAVLNALGTRSEEDRGRQDRHLGGRRPRRSPA